MKAIVVGCQIKPYEFTDQQTKETKKGVSCRLMVVKGRVSASEGSYGVEASSYKCEATVAEPVAKILMSLRCPQVFDLDIDVAGTGERVKAVVLGAEHLGSYDDFNLDFVSGLHRPAPQPQPRAAVAANGAPTRQPAAVG